jgi:hypothetical protein
MYAYQKNMYETLAHMVWTGAEAQPGAVAGEITLPEIVSYLDSDWEAVQALMNTPPPMSAGGPG